jgi:hypothetical protein
MRAPHVVTDRVRPAGLLALTATACVVLTIVPAAGAAAPEPTLAVTTPRVSPGQTLSIHGEHWPKRTTLHAVLCGANATNGSVDCVEQAAMTVSPGPTGVVDGSMPVFEPPVPCPCVVLVTDLASAFVGRLPVTVVGVPTSAIDPEDPTPGRALQIDARLTGGTSLASLFGVSARRTLVVTLRNTGEVPVDAPVVTARWGRGSKPTDLVGSVTADDLPPGVTRSVEIDVRLEAAAIGNYTVAAEVVGAGKPITARVTTTTWPWGWLLLVQGVLLALRNAIRRRIIRDETRARRTERAAERAASRQAAADRPDELSELLR